MPTLKQSLAVDRILDNPEDHDEAIVAEAEEKARYWEAQEDDYWQQQFESDYGGGR